MNILICKNNSKFLHSMQDKAMIFSVSVMLEKRKWTKVSFMVTRGCKCFPQDEWVPSQFYIEKQNEEVAQHGRKN